jgi:hypothetical protein
MRPFVLYVHPSDLLVPLGSPVPSYGVSPTLPLLAKCGMSLVRGGAAHSRMRTAGKSMMVGVGPMTPRCRRNIVERGRGFSDVRAGLRVPPEGAAM